MLHEQNEIIIISNLAGFEPARIEIQNFDFGQNYNLNL